MDYPISTYPCRINVSHLVEEGFCRNLYSWHLTDKTVSFIRPTRPVINGMCRHGVRVCLYCLSPPGVPQGSILALGTSVSILGQFKLSICPYHIAVSVFLPWPFYLSHFLSLCLFHFPSPTLLLLCTTFFLWKGYVSPVLSPFCHSYSAYKIALFNYQLPRMHHVHVCLVKYWLCPLSPGLCSCITTIKGISHITNSQPIQG